MIEKKNFKAIKQLIFNEKKAKYKVKLYEPDNNHHIFDKVKGKYISKEVLNVYNELKSHYKISEIN